MRDDRSRTFELGEPAPGGSPAMSTAATASALHHVPARLTSFVGREREITEITALLGAHRPVTLAPLSDAAYVPNAVATALVVREQPGQPLTATRIERLGTRRLLLLLDTGSAHETDKMPRYLGAPA